MSTSMYVLPLVDVLSVQTGYTFTCEALTGCCPTTVTGGVGQWKLRLIGAPCLVPYSVDGGINSTFTIQEHKGYYVETTQCVTIRYYGIITIQLLDIIHLIG